MLISYVLAKNWRFAPKFARLTSLAGLFTSLAIQPNRSVSVQTLATWGQTFLLAYLLTDDRIIIIDVYALDTGVIRKCSKRLSALGKKIDDFAFSSQAHFNSVNWTELTYVLTFIIKWKTTISGRQPTTKEKARTTPYYEYNPQL